MMHIIRTENGVTLPAASWQEGIPWTPPKSRRQTPQCDVAKAILAAMRQHGGRMKSPQIAKAVRKEAARVRAILDTLRLSGAVVRIEEPRRGNPAHWWKLPDA